MTITPSTERFGTRQNAKTWANKFRARVLEPGIVSYEDQGCGKALLRKETIDRYINSFVGRPLILTVDNSNQPTYKHARVCPTTLEKMARGYISNVVYNDVDGWWYAEGTVHDDAAKQAIKDVGYVSCAYDVREIGGGGEYHNISYNEEITAFEGEHLAIVDNPRYEEATIRFNSKTKIMFKWIKKLLATNSEAGESKTNSVETQEGEIPEGASLVVEGQEVPVTDLVAAHKKSNSKPETVYEIEIDGKKVEVKILEELYRANSTLKKENAEPVKDTDDDTQEDKKNSTEEEEKKDKENAKPVVNTTPGKITQARENAFNFEVTGNAPDTTEAKLARGASRYGSAKK